MDTGSKPHTSTAVKDRYNRKAYRQYSVKIKPELFDRLSAYADQHGVSRSEFLARALDALEQ